MFWQKFRKNMENLTLALGAGVVALTISVATVDVAGMIVLSASSNCWHADSYSATVSPWFAIIGWRIEIVITCDSEIKSVDSWLNTHSDQIRIITKHCTSIFGYTQRWSREWNSSGCTILSKAILMKNKNLLEESFTKRCYGSIWNGHFLTFFLKIWT